MIKIGVFGAGHLGRIHINLLNSSNKFKLVGFYDPDKNSINKLNEKNNCKYYDSPLKLIKEVDVIDIVSPTSSHLEMAMLAIDNKKHVVNILKALRTENISIKNIDKKKGRLTAIISNYQESNNLSESDQKFVIEKISKALEKLS